MLNRQTINTADIAGLDGYRRVAVTGGCGFVGSHLVAALAARGRPVTVVDLAPPPPGWPPQVEVRRPDIRDTHAVTAALRGADLVFHLAGNSSGTVSVDRPRFDFETNAQGTFNVCEAIAASGGDGWCTSRPRWSTGFRAAVPSTSSTRWAPSCRTAHPSWPASTW